MHLLATFAAFSMAGTVLLSLLPEGGIKRTAAMAVGLLESLDAEIITQGPIFIE